MTKRDHRPLTPAALNGDLLDPGTAQARHGQGERPCTATAAGTSASTGAASTGAGSTSASTDAGPAATTGAAATTATIAAADGWPWRTYLELEAFASAVPQARRHVRDSLAQWGLSEVRDDVELITCELLTNAISASAALPFRASVGLLLAACPGKLTALVWDASLQPPVLSGPDDDAVAGRGLAIVEALSTRWGWVPDERGKIVWAMLDLGPAPGCSCATYHGVQS